MQLTSQDARRDHYLPLDFAEWRYVELDAPEDGRSFWGYTGAYSWMDIFYEPSWHIYNDTKQLDLYLNGLPAGAKAEVLIGRLEGLEETAASVKSPTLEVAGKKLTFPLSVQPEEYLEMDFYGRCRLFDRNGKLIAHVTPQGQLKLAPGANRVALSCEADEDASTRAEVTLAVRGEPIPQARRAGVKTTSYAGLRVPQ